MIFEESLNPLVCQEEESPEETPEESENVDEEKPDEEESLE